MFVINVIFFNHSRDYEIDVEFESSRCMKRTVLRLDLECVFFLNGFTMAVTTMIHLSLLNTLLEVLLSGISTALQPPQCKLQQVKSLYCT